MSIPAFNGSLSYVFLESALRPAYVGLGFKPEDVWNATRKQSGAKPFFETSVDVVKSSSSVLKLDGMEVSLNAAQVEDTYPALVAAFEKAEDARTFYDDLNRQLEKGNIQHALRETARLNEGGKIRIVGFQI
jgi:hypothetical protein